MTTGEPAGIGPDLAILLASEPHRYPIIVIADQLLVQQRAQQLDCCIDLLVIDDCNYLDTNSHFTGQGQLLCLHIPLCSAVQIGQLNYLNASYVLTCLNCAIDLSLHNPLIKGLVTGPIHKGIINDFYQKTNQADKYFSGHTEYLADLSSTNEVIMMLACEKLKVALVTTHLPLREIADHITKDKIVRIIELLNSELKIKFGLHNPQIYVTGLNPHAGENGHLGMEEINEIIPAIKYCQSSNMDVYGPYPADTIFTPNYMDKADVILAMYHDQGLAVLKHLSFNQAVNITLGLPFIRTSVDHGTALELAGQKDKIHMGSLLYAINSALEMSQD